MEQNLIIKNGNKMQIVSNYTYLNNLFIRL